MRKTTALIAIALGCACTHPLPAPDRPVAAPANDSEWTPRGNPREGALVSVAVAVQRQGQAWSSLPVQGGRLENGDRVVVNTVAHENTWFYGFGADRQGKVALMDPAADGAHLQVNENRRLPAKGTLVLSGDPGPESFVFVVSRTPLSDAKVRAQMALDRALKQAVEASAADTLNLASRGWERETEPGHVAIDAVADPAGVAVVVVSYEHHP
jgi:hypothetical protein